MAKLNSQTVNAMEVVLVAGAGAAGRERAGSLRRAGIGLITKIFINIIWTFQTYKHRYKRLRMSPT